MPDGAMAVEKFPGLRLDLDPYELGLNGAMDLRDVDLRQPGRVERRMGLATFTTLAGVSIWGIAPYFTSAGVPRFVALTAEGAGLDQVRLRSATAAGFSALTATGIVSTRPYPSFARLGTPSGTFAFIAANVFTAPWSYDGTTFAAIAAPTGMTRCQFVAATADGRLAVAGTVDASGLLAHRVAFSDPLAPTTFAADNYVDLQPGDGEPFRGVVQWDRNTYLFKTSKFFVVGVPSTDALGAPVWDPRTVDGIRGPVDYNQVAAGRNGVYFANPQGVWITRGGPPQLVSQHVQPLFDGTDIGIGGGTAITAIRSVTCADDYVYVAISHATLGSRTLCLDERSGTWTMHSFNAGDGCEHRMQSDGRARLYTVGSGTTIRELTESSTTDAGSAFDAYYRSGFYEPGDGGVTAIRRSAVDGTGTVKLNVATDGQAFNTSNQATLTLGASAPDRGWRLRAERARRVSHELRGSTSWSVHRLEHHVGRSRRPAVELT